MLARKGERKRKQIAKSSFIWEYKLKNKNMGFDVAEIDGRFPDSGRTLNTVCQEIYYVISGEGTIFIEGEKVELKEGDMLLIEPGKRYYTVGEKLVLALATSPNWYPEQQKRVE